MANNDTVKKPASRFLILGAILLLMMGALIYKLFDVTIAQGESYSEEANSLSTREIITKGKRGR